MLVAALVVVGVFVRAAAWSGTLVFLSRGALKLHNRAVGSLALVPVTYFDSQPSGRLLGRLSDDYEKVAREIPNYISDILSGTMELLWAVVVVVVGAPLLLGLALPCGYSYYRLQVLFVATSREMQRLAKVLEAPSLGLFAEVLSAEAAQTIRVHGKSLSFCDELERRQRAFGRAVMVGSRTTRWLNMRLKLNSETFALGVAVFVVFALGQGHLGVAMAGFLMTLSIGLDGTMQWVTRAVSLLEPALVSVERVSMLGDLEPQADVQGPQSQINQGLRSAQHLPRELDREQSARWRLCIDSVVASYRADLPDVLHGLSFCVEPGEHLGIIGRTGAGKSSLFQLLYRMVHVRSGRVLLESPDGDRTVDLLALPLEEARSLFTIVPQQPVLFSGSIRYNMDRLGFWSDSEIWRVLEQVCMASTVAQLPGGLSYHLTEGGSNLSAGERQLLCIGRAALNPIPRSIGKDADLSPRIVLLDEATASVDHRTDALIGAALNAVFGRNTMLVIAHRLETVQGCDRVVALGDGRVLLEGKPREVLARVQFEAGQEGRQFKVWL
jgi:ABC-type multidrug transport system fused ATPase/permease subunit